jgi:hypothetical protein
MRNARCKSEGAAMLQARKDLRSGNPWSAGVVSVFESTEQAQAALDRLERGGFDLSKLSVIGKEEPSAAHQMGIAVAGAQARVWGQRSALWARLAETPVATALAWVPFIGYLAAVGPVACVLVGSRHPGPGAPQTSALERMLALAGIPPGEMRTYESALQGGQLLMLVHGGATDAARARQLMKSALSLNAGGRS